MTKAQTAYDWIHARLNDGLTVFVASQTRITKVSPKNAKSHNDNGKPVFKVSKNGNDLLMIERNQYVCIIQGESVLNRISAQ
jgi:hypothetical protein